MITYHILLLLSNVYIIHIVDISESFNMLWKVNIWEKINNDILDVLTILDFGWPINK